VKAKFPERKNKMTIKTDVKNNLLEPRPFALSFSSFFKDLLPFSSSPYRYSRWAGPARPLTGLEEKLSTHIQIKAHIQPLPSFLRFQRIHIHISTAGGSSRRRQDDRRRATPTSATPSVVSPVANGRPAGSRRPSSPRRHRSRSLMHA